MPLSGLPLLVVEDDDGDALLIEELLLDGGVTQPVVRAHDLAGTLRVLERGPVHCVLLDMGLPDGRGIENVHAVLAAAPATPVVVFTGLADDAAGRAAVAAGAQDYLVKGGVDAQLLARSIGYAVERRKADVAARALYLAELRRAENARLERGLLPTPMLSDASLSHGLRYRPSVAHAVIGGDFYDCIEGADGTVHLLVGDIAGHGPDEAALGVYLRIAWRTLVLNGTPGALVLPALDRVLCSERLSDEVFATACTIDVEPSRDRAWLRLAGHHPPICLDPEPHLLDTGRRGPGLGMFDDAEWPAAEVELGADWSLLLYTDGLIEGHSRDDGDDRFSIEGVLGIIAREKDAGRSLNAFLDVLVSQVEVENGGPLADDVAVFLLQHRRPLR